MLIFSCCGCGSQTVQPKKCASSSTMLAVLSKINKFVCNDKVGWALLMTGLAFIPMSGGLSLMTLIPALASLIPVSVGIGLGSSLVSVGTMILSLSTMRCLVDRARLEAQQYRNDSSRSSVDIENDPKKVTVAADEFEGD